MTHDINERLITSSLNNVIAFRKESPFLSNLSLWFQMVESDKEKQLFLMTNPCNKIKSVCTCRLDLDSIILKNNKFIGIIRLIYRLKYNSYVVTCSTNQNVFKCKSLSWCYTAKCAEKINPFGMKIRRFRLSDIYT